MRQVHIQRSHRGELHRDLGVPQGKPVPEAKLEQAKRSADPVERKRATFAENARHWTHSGRADPSAVAALNAIRLPVQRR